MRCLYEMEMYHMDGIVDIVEAQSSAAALAAEHLGRLVAQEPLDDTVQDSEVVAAVAEQT